jgi:hypothetical protein
MYDQRISANSMVLLLQTESHISEPPLALILRVNVAQLLLLSGNTSLPTDTLQVSRDCTDNQSSRQLVDELLINVVTYHPSLESIDLAYQPPPPPGSSKLSSRRWWPYGNSGIVVSDVLVGITLRLTNIRSISTCVAIPPDVLRHIAEYPHLEVLKCHIQRLDLQDQFGLLSLKALR